MYDEWSLFFILQSYSNLIITWETIHEGEQSMASYIIHKDIEVGQHKVVLRTSLLKRLQSVHIPTFPFLFGYRNYIG